MPKLFTFSNISKRNSSILLLAPLALSSCISIGAISDSLANNMAFSALPPMPIPNMPGGHQPAPIWGTTSKIQSTMLSFGLSIASLALFSEPPPLAAICTSTLSPATKDTCTTAGVLSLVLPRFPAGSLTIEARNLFSGNIYARCTPSFTICSISRVASHCTFIPTLTKATTMPVSWQSGLLPSAHMRELVKICAIASLAAGDCSAS